MLNNKFYYNPNVNYYFLSVQYVGISPAWIRRPFLTKEEVDEFIFGEYMLSPDSYKNLEILNESFLKEKIHVHNDLGELVEIDIRSWLFDERYSSQSKNYESILTGRGFRYKMGFSAHNKSEV